MSVALKFNALEDFEPARVAEQVPALKALLETRNKLRDLLRGRPVRSIGKSARTNPQNESELKTLSGELGICKTGELSHAGDQDGRRTRGFRRRPTEQRAGLLDQVVAATKQTAPDRAQELAKTLVEQALAGTVTFDRNLPRTLEGAIAAIDRKLSEQLNEIIHHPRFVQLEGTWRGLNYLVMNSETGTSLKSARAQCPEERAY